MLIIGELLFLAIGSSVWARGLGAIIVLSPPSPASIRVLMDNTSSAIGEYRGSVGRRSMYLVPILALVLDSTRTKGGGGTSTAKAVAVMVCEIESEGVYSARCFRWSSIRLSMVGSEREIGLGVDLSATGTTCSGTGTDTGASDVEDGSGLGTVGNARAAA